MAIRDGSRLSAGPPWHAITMKHISLIALTLQNSALILILYYSRIMPPVNGQRYFASTAVFLNEVVKLAVCLTVALYEISGTVAPSVPATSLFSALVAQVFSGDSWKLAVPALLYTLQNSLQFVAISNLDAATLQVTYQFKILPTAIFSVLILRRSLSAQKWTALALLMFGVAVVQIPAQAASAMPTPLQDAHARIYLPRSLEALGFWGTRGARAGTRGATARGGGLHRRSATYEGIVEDLLAENPARSQVLGLAAALGACTVSALGSVYFEKILKESTSKVSIWVRNVQLSVYSMFPALFIGVIFIDGEAIARSGFFVGYNSVVWTVIAFQAMGGIIVALCVHYADNIAKSFATSISILLSLCLSIIFFDFTMTHNFLIGTSIVMLATYLYNSADGRARPPPVPIVGPTGNPVTIPSEKAYDARGFAIKLPTSPLLREEGLTTSRPGSPMLHHTRKGSARSYFEAKKE